MTMIFHFRSCLLDPSFSWQRRARFFFPERRGKLYCPQFCFSLRLRNFLTGGSHRMGDDYCMTPRLTQRFYGKNWTERNAAMGTGLWNNRMGSCPATTAKTRCKHSCFCPTLQLVDTIDDVRGQKAIWFLRTEETVVNK